MDAVAAYDPSRATPLFTAQYTTCAYPISDIYAELPRVLYYCLLAAVFIFQWHPWLANVFLGAAATYAGTASIEAMILLSNWPSASRGENVTIPVVQNSSLAGNDTLLSLDNLIVDMNSVWVQPAALELDIDAILAIVVTAYLFMLPIHCFSSTIRGRRALHLLMGLWNLMMLAGTICALILWPRLYDTPLQQRFCYPAFPDADVTNNDPNTAVDPSVWRSDWNSTIWGIFSNLTEATFELGNNCLNPCFNTSQIMRRASSLQSSLSASQVSPRTQYDWTYGYEYKIENLQGLMYAMVVIVGSIALGLLAINVTGLFAITRVPVGNPRHLFGRHGRELMKDMWSDIKSGADRAVVSLFHPHVMMRRAQATTRGHKRKVAWKLLRFCVDILALCVVFVALVLTPATMIVFIVWIEWYIRHDIVSDEAPNQVGQWSAPVSIALVLVSAILLRTRHKIASMAEIEKEVEETQEKLAKLEELLATKRPRRPSRFELEERSSSTTPSVNLIPK